MRSLKIRWKSDTAPAKGSKSLYTPLSDSFPSHGSVREKFHLAQIRPHRYDFLRATVSSCYKKILFYSAGDKLSPIQVAYAQIDLHTLQKTGIYANTYIKNTYNHSHEEHAII